MPFLYALILLQSTYELAIYSRVEREVIHQICKCFNAACGSTDGYNRGVVLVRNGQGALSLCDVWPIVFAHSFGAHKFLSGLGAEPAGPQENGSVITSSKQCDGPMRVSLVPQVAGESLAPILCHS